MSTTHISITKKKEQEEEGGKKQKPKRNEQHQLSEIPIDNQQGAIRSELYSIFVITYKGKDFEKEYIYTHTYV